MAGRKLIDAWLEKADQDFDYAEASLEDELDFFAQICFHFNQAAEKYFKAYIVKHGLEFRKIHDLLELLKICAAHDNKLNSLKEDCIFLNRFYIETRYPVHWPSNFKKSDATEARERAEHIRDEIKSLLRV